MTPYALLLQGCGLSQADAAALHGAPRSTVLSWSCGARTARPSAVAQLVALHRQIADGAQRVSAAINASAAGQVEIGYPADDQEAQAMGFPCVGVWRAMAAIVVASVERPVILSPRGSTRATGAAVDARG